MFHAVLGFASNELRGNERALLRLFAFGHEAVAVFIVLSGYCLMLPVVRSWSVTPETPTSSIPLFNVPAYFARRAFRILPPYYAALLFSLALLAAVPALRQPNPHTIWDDSLPGLTASAVASHLFLVHNWAPQWAYQINGPLWSVATEWQIYFFFPSVLLPAWRRFGTPAAVLVAIALGSAPMLLLPRASASACPWYLGLFAFGMAAAHVGFSQRPFVARLRERLPWGWLSGLACAGCGVFGIGFARFWFRDKTITDPLVGAATALLLVYLTLRRPSMSKPPRLLGLLEAPALVQVGHFSYSLYLTHLPIVALCYLALSKATLSPFALALALLLVGTLASLGVGYLFFLTVERHFLRPSARLRRYLQPVIPQADAQDPRLRASREPER